MATKSPVFKKSVSFSEDTKPEPGPEKAPGLETTGYNPTLADFTFKGSKVIEVDDDDMEVASYPVMPKDDTPEEAALRREMLQYQLSEVGQVVAEIDLDGRDDDYSDDDEGMDDDYESEDDSDDEEEDEHGRSTRPYLSEEYKQQMRELEAKLNAQMIENLGPRPETNSLAEYADDVRRLVVKKGEANEMSGEPMDTSKPAPVQNISANQRTEAGISSTSASDPGQPSQPETKKAKTKTKGVRFADSLDISSAPEPVCQPSTLAQPPASSKPDFMADTIAERAPTAPQVPAPAARKPAKVSRFKSARSAPEAPAIVPPPPSEPTPLPTGPPDRTLSNTVIEHAPPPFQSAPPDEFSPSVLDREVRLQYNKLRNKIIGQQGGFKARSEEEDEEGGPLLEEGEDGKVRKVSRFMAARLKADGDA